MSPVGDQLKSRYLWLKNSCILDGPGIDGTERLLAVVTTDTLDSEEVTVVMEISLMNDMMNTNDSTDE